MKNAIKGIIYTVSALFIVWFILSWTDVVTDNTERKPQHNEHNMFVIMTQESVSKCDKSLEGTNRVTFGTVYQTTNNSVIFETTEGELYEVYVDYPDEFEGTELYCLVFQGDEIVKVFVEFMHNDY